MRARASSMVASHVFGGMEFLELHRSRALRLEGVVGFEERRVLLDDVLGEDELVTLHGAFEVGRESLDVEALAAAVAGGGGIVEARVERHGGERGALAVEDGSLHLAHELPGFGRVALHNGGEADPPHFDVGELRRRHDRHLDLLLEARLVEVARERGCDGGTDGDEEVELESREQSADAAHKVHRHLDEARVEGLLGGDLGELAQLRAHAEVQIVAREERSSEAVVELHAGELERAPHQEVAHLASDVPSQPRLDRFEDEKQD
mmetsp:Transcript_26151/g.85909  ORF Transcript_26151/g.85909 Transcript_26151/m.85909 type:complete len:264 (+) Transcript_26151:1416-2207(+)